MSSVSRLHATQGSSEPLQNPGRFRWASCSKCNVLHFAGFPDVKGACTAGGQHEQTGSFKYAVPFDVPGDGRVEQGWKSCRKCQTLYWPSGADHGACPAGGQHDATGSFAYAAQWLPEKASVNWVGLECIVRQESEDEVYGGIAVVSADGAYHHTHPFPDNGPYWTMGHGGQRLVFGDIPLYSGPAIGLSVTASLVEWDSDSDAKDKYGKALAEAAGDAAAVAANSYVPGSGVIARPVVEFLTEKDRRLLSGKQSVHAGGVHAVGGRPHGSAVRPVPATEGRRPTQRSVDSSARAARHRRRGRPPLSQGASEPAPNRRRRSGAP